MNTFLKKWVLCFALLSFSFITMMGSNGERNTINFNKGWKFNLGDVPEAKNPGFDDSNWRTLNLPHDWSIEGEFNEKNPAGTGGGALPGGIGWYRKEFTVSPSEKGKSVSIDFDGVYRNSEVWINGHYLGIRPYGYSSFRYHLTPYLLYGKKNVIAVKVDNSVQPNSRWYSGSGIYRNVWLVYTGKVAVAHWGTCITTPEIKTDLARVHIVTKLNSANKTNQPVVLKTSVYNKEGQLVGSASSKVVLSKKTGAEISQNLSVKDPALWSVDRPYLYKAVSQVQCGGKLSDEYETSFGIRHFTFDQQRGFLLNGQQVKIKGVCDHHDLGCLGAAINTRALERQLEILKAMGCNGIRTSHNPPAPELLDLCDRMGFVVMDEAFDMWKKQKTKYDYHLDWDKWHKRDLEDMILRDRNHPSIVLWSIGNEIPEQGSLAGDTIARELASIVKKLDDRPITSACNHVSVDNHIIRSGALDVVGTNYFQKWYPDFPAMFPGKPYVASETTSALATRGSYDMPSELIRRWPVRDKGVSPQMNSDLTCSAYDNCSAPWGSTHEETWKMVKKLDYMSGMFIWTGFDYIGEPTPYPWPAKSSYFGIIDLAGFPKDAYYMYQSEWTAKPVLHIFPHWNWNPGDTVDVWAYSNCQEVELFLNGKSLGTKHKEGDALHLLWRVPYIPGTLKAVGRTNGVVVLTDEVRTANAPARIILSADRSNIHADGSDLSFVTVKIVDKNGVMVPRAGNLVKFNIEGPGFIAGVDNGNPVSLESFKASERKAFNGLCLAIVQAKENPGKIVLTATGDGLEPASLTIDAR